MPASNSSPGAFLYILLFVILSLGALYLMKDYSGPESLPAQSGPAVTSLSKTNNPEESRPGGDERIEGYRQFVIASRSYESFPPSHCIGELKEMGLADPVVDLKVDLKRHPELIPYKGHFGGTMGFYSPDQIYVISSEWALAYFEDGHTGGYVLLKYTVGADGRISWKTVDAFED